MAIQSYQQRSDSSTPTSAPHLGRPFVVPTLQAQEEQTEAIQASPAQAASLLTNRYQVSASTAYQPQWIARAHAPQTTVPEAAAPEETEEKLDETLERSPSASPPSTPPEDPDDTATIQTKLTIGQPNDRYEQEADRVAEQVMSMPDTAIQRTSEETEGSNISAKAIAGITRIQRKMAGPPKANGELEAQLNASKGGGSPLPEEVRSFMEPRFGADFSGVRVHTGGDAVQMNREVGAKAFAHGNHLYFGAGYAPGNDALTAHELTHTIQQTGRAQLQQKGKNRDRNKLNNIKAQQKEQVASPEKKPSQSGVNLQPETKAVEPENNQQNNQQPISSKQESVHQTHDETTDLTPTKNVQNLGTPVKNNVVAFSTKGVPASGETQQNTPISPEAKSINPAAIGSPPPIGEAVAAGVNASIQSAMPSAAGAAPAIESGESNAEEAGVADSTEDPELATISQETEGVALPEEAKAEAAADLQEIGAAGGEAPASMGGGGGGSAIADKPTPPTPDISQSEDPAQALATIANLPPMQLQNALSGVGAVVDKSVNKEKAEISNNLPQIEVGAEGASDASIDLGLGKDKNSKGVQKAPEGASKPTPAPKPLPALPAPAKAAVTPAVQGGTDGKLSSQDVQNLQTSLNRLPTTDPAAGRLKADAPPLKLEGDANPQQAQAQRAKLESSVNETYTQGQQEVAQSLGEERIKATVPKEVIQADAGGPVGGAVAAGGAATGGGAVPGGGPQGEAGADDGISIIAQEKQGAQIQAAVAQAQGQMAAERQGHQVKVAQEKQKSQAEINKLQADNVTEQQQEKLKAKTEADQLRSDWTKEQDQLVTQSRKEADQEISKGNQDVQTEQVQAEQTAQQEIASGNKQAEVERQKGEQQAEAERQKGQKEASGGFFGWLADKAKAFFDQIKQGIQRAFEAARAAIKGAIEAAQKLATAAIEAGRKAIVGIIRRVGDRLIALGDRLLAHFPEVRDRFRKLIQDKVKQAEAAVNRIAENLKKNVKAALNLLAKGLDAALGLLQKGLMAAVALANQAVQGAISAAKAAAQALGTFAVLIKDIAGNPGQWISNLAAGVMDGIKNHLWGAFQTAIKEWFNQKLEEVLGVGLTVWNVLKQGGINLAEIGNMAWEGIKAAIPPALIQILIEKVVSMIIPAAGAVLAIIEGLQAAWGTVSRIIQAMERFVSFLKAVKSGASGPVFGQLLASAGVILVDFVSNWLLKRVRGAASKVAGKIKAIAQKIGTKLKNTYQKVTKKLRGGMQKLGNKAKKIKEKLFSQKDKKNAKANIGDKKLSKEEKKQQEIKKRVEKAQRELPPKVKNLLTKKPSRLRVMVQFALWRIAYKLSRFELQGKEGKINIIAQVNPMIDLANGWSFERSEVLKVLDKVAQEYIGNAESDKASPVIPANKLAPGKSYQLAQTVGGQPISYGVKEYGKEDANKPTGITPSGESNWRPNYFQLANRLKGVDMGDVIKKIIRKEPLPNLNDKQRESVGMLHALWFGKEASHPKNTYGHRRDLAYSLMVSELMTEKEGHKKFNIAEGVGLHPSSFKGAQEGARQMTAEMLDKDVPPPSEGTAKERNYTNRSKREVALIKEWFKRHLEDLPLLDRQPTINDVEHFIREKLRYYVRGQ